MKTNKRNISNLIILLIIGLLNFSCTAEKESLSIVEMRNDIDSLVKIIEEIHINPYYKVSKIDFYKEIDSLKNNLTAEKDTIEFWKYVAPVVARLEDGHTYVYFPYNYFIKKKPLVFPFIVKTSNYSPYISIQDGDNSIPAKSEIISINGIPSKDLISEYLQYESGEDIQSRAEWIADGFEYYINAVSNIKEKCIIEYKTDNEVFTSNIKFIPLPEFLIKQQAFDGEDEETEEPYTLKVKEDVSIAIIDFRSFDGIERMKLFADSAFTMIKEKKIDNLIIDLRENGGGNSGVGDELFQYLAKSDFRQYSDQTIIKSSPQLKYTLKAEKEKLKEKKHLTLIDSLDLTEINRVLETPYGQTTTCHYAKNATTLKDDLPMRFTGNLYILCSKLTYSSASDFAQTIKAYNLGKIIGEETGGWIVCYGDTFYDLLPHSRLIVGVSGVKFINQGAKSNDWHGVIPDIIVPSDESMEYVLEMIKEKNMRGF